MHFFNRHYWYSDKFLMIKLYRQTRKSYSHLFPQEKPSTRGHARYNTIFELVRKFNFQFLSCKSRLDKKLTE